MTKTVEQWDERFGEALESSQGSLFFNVFGDDLALVQAQDPALIWSIFPSEIEDDRSLFISPGMSSDADGYIVAGSPITADELASGEWSGTIWVSEADYHDRATRSTIESRDPTDTEPTQAWFDRFGALVKDDNDEANLDPDDPRHAAIIGDADPSCLWSVFEDEIGNLRISPGYASGDAVVNVLVSERPFTDDERVGGEWDELLWYDAEPAYLARP